MSITGKAKQMIEILFGNFLLCAGVYFFVLPHNILTGGLAGIANILNLIIPVNRIVLMDILDLSFFFLGIIVLGKDFAIKTAISALIYPVYLWIFKYIPYMPSCNNVTAAIFGGLISGAGIGLVFKNNGSTGGTDVPMMIIHKYFGVNLDSLEMIVDGSIAALGLFISGFDQLLLGLLSIFVSSYAINKVLLPSTEGSTALMIISSRIDEINQYVQNSLHRGSTILTGKGGYQKTPREILMVVVSRNQYAKLVEKLDEIDPQAFVFTTKSRDVLGEGFTYARI